MNSTAWNRVTWQGCTRRTVCLVRPQQNAVSHSGADTLSAASTQRPPPQPSLPSPSSLSLRVSQRIAAARTVETRRRDDRNGNNGDGGGGQPLFVDPYAELLAGWEPCEPCDHQQQQQLQEVVSHTDVEVRRQRQRHQMCSALDVIATAHLDRLLLNATSVSAVNRITQGDYRQVVLLGDGMDTRPYRLPLAPGTTIFLVAPAAVHAAAAAALASDEAAAIADAVAATALVDGTTSGGIAGAAVQAVGGGEGGGEEGFGGGQDQKPAKLRNRLRGPRPPPGCLLRRIPLELQPGADFSSLGPSLEAAGFRADRLSVWVVQGLSGLGLMYKHVVSLLAEAAHGAAYHSLLLGELPYMSYNQAADALADCGLLGAPLAFGTRDSNYDRWREEWSHGAVGEIDGDANDVGVDGDGGGCTEAAAADQANRPRSRGTGVMGSRRGSGSGVDAGEEDEGMETGAGVGAEAVAAGAPQRWLFAAQQIRLSAAQMDVYAAHRTAAEETDEDFFDNFS